MICNKLKINKLIIKRLYFRDYNHIIERYQKTKFEKICLKCLKYKYTNYKECSKTLKYYIYVKNYKIINYKYSITSYLTLMKKVYIYLFIKCIYYKSSYFIISNNCFKKKTIIEKNKKK